MAGTLEGGIKAAETNKKNDPEFYKRIGAMGGKAINKNPLDVKPKGFAANRELARRAGALGGWRSRRGPSRKDA